MKWLKKLFGKFLCFTGDHDWTSRAMEGIEPNAIEREMAKTDPLAGFKKYSRMYCRRCGRYSDLEL